MFKYWTVNSRDLRGGSRTISKEGGGVEGGVDLIILPYLLYVFGQTGLNKPERDSDIYQGPVVQSVVSLTSSLRVISLTVLADSIYNILIIFAEKIWVAFAMQKLLTFFQQKNSQYLRIIRCKF